MILQGDILEQMATLDDNSVDCCITSPPYWQLRDYGWTGQWGLEPTYQEYLEHLWQFMDVLWEKLKDTGTVWINLGDTYFGGTAGAGGNCGRHIDDGVNKHGKATRFDTGIKKTGLPDKCLALIPSRFAIGCIERGWILRNDIIWNKPNGMPESVTDRLSKKHEHIFFFVKKQKYYFDLDGIREELKYKEEALKPFRGKGKFEFLKQGNHKTHSNPNGKNPGDVWTVNTKPSSLNHYASYNNDLIDRPIIAGCPKGGTILDPFCGTGTTIRRAKELGRVGIGIEGNPEYVKIARRQLDAVSENLFN